MHLPLWYFVLNLVCDKFMNKSNSSTTTLKLLAIILVVFVITMFILVRDTNSATTEMQSNNVLISDNLQTISIEANNAGYLPSTTFAQADINTVLIVDSIATYGCAQTLTIPKLGIQKVLPSNGKLEIEIPPQDKDTKLQGSCTSGIYTFTISFI
jgi:plastocyanin domain-containing protein